MERQQEQFIERWWCTIDMRGGVIERKPRRWRTGLTASHHRAACLSDGILSPIDSQQLKNAVAVAIEEPLGELDAIKSSPGFQRAAAASLSKAWSAGVKLQEEAEAAADEKAKARVVSLRLARKGSFTCLPANGDCAGPCHGGDGESEGPRCSPQRRWPSPWRLPWGGVFQ